MRNDPVVKVSYLFRSLGAITGSKQKVPEKTSPITLLSTSTVTARRALCFHYVPADSRLNFLPLLILLQANENHEKTGRGKIPHLFIPLFAEQPVFPR